ncbi:MAG TPA: hypothetical protein VE152_03535, partial [Acidimicrobiales bacterium]|nr:hypothetical protein [Acidimicrobiales bacterium]
PPAASRLCDRMVAAGLVLRELNPANRREVTLRLSPDGTALLAELSARRREQLVGILRAMPPAGREALVSGLRAFAAQGASGPPGRGATRAPSGEGRQGGGAYGLRLLW